MVRRLIRRLMLFSGSLLLQATTAAAQSVVTGEVREDSSGRPLAGVEVLIERTRLLVVTDPAGRYVLSGAPSGTRILLFRFVGYRPVRQRVEVPRGDTLLANATLVREGAQQLEPVEVTGRPEAPRGIGREAFEERRRLGFGKFIDSTDLRRWEGRRLSEVLRGRTGIRMVNYREPLVTPRGGRMPSTVLEIRAASPVSRDGGQCWMSVILDGVTIYRSGSVGGRPPDFSREFSIASLEAVEYYRGPSETPLEFEGSGSECGILVLWTRRR